ncbi:sialidase family protein [Budvicia aquatica]|uniref:Glycosyl hydrolase n=1 Tax=Budvicia aquatica TaxID=82979 RepID=A0A2C6DUM0_9GAMM|nr:exo-alpha-sialidase [Budvicia aquatica]PHI32534.1 glycosyl hydrolase [Budvicia aquatica]VFS45569.1 Predicted neuraminidase (sialidase) [Budvicia aquatica]
MTAETITVERTGKVRSCESDPVRIEAYLPSECPQNHAANLLPLPNGDLLCTWFSGTQEGIADISIYMSRLAKGSNLWTKPVKLSDDSSRSEQNPVLFLDPDNILWLMYTAQKSGNQDTAFVRYRQSKDLGETWGAIETLFSEPGTFIRQPVTVLSNGDWIVPVFYCRVQPGEKWVGNNDDSAVKISSDKGKSWREYSVPQSTGCVHMNVTVLNDGSLIALYRSRWADFIYLSRSFDNGKTWSAPQATSLPNNNSSIQVTTLNNGHLALVFNNMSAADCSERRTSLYDEIEDEEDKASGKEVIIPTEGRSAFWGAPRAPMTLAISEDNGKTWPYLRNIEVGDGYCMTNNSQQKLNREFSYPSIKQSADGKLHIAFTYYRQTIKYVSVDEEWVKAGEAAL